MKTFKSAFFLIVIITGAACFETKGQVTIGSDLAPLSGVLLDIKSKAATTGTGEATTDAAGGGLGLPRVALTNEADLAPFIPSATSDQKKERTGLMVYNISSAPPFKPGVYIWDGSKWNVAGGGVKWFYMPSINIPATQTTSNETINLYDEYKKQFTKLGNGTWASSNSSLNSVPSPESTGLYTADQLDYVITYYDTNVFENVSINTAGLMTYKAKTLITTPATYFNIIFVVK